MKIGYYGIKKLKVDSLINDKKATYDELYCIAKYIYCIFLNLILRAILENLF